MAAAEATTSGIAAGLPERPTCVICLGMAGSGKTTFVQVGILYVGVAHRACVIYIPPEDHIISPFLSKSSICCQPWSSRVFCTVPSQHRCVPLVPLIYHVSYGVCRHSWLCQLQGGHEWVQAGAQRRYCYRPQLICIKIWPSHGLPREEIIWTQVTMLIATCLLNAILWFRYIIFDTPGQLEVFTWSASGTIITETLVGSVCVPV